jgi:hypothetical protein
MAGILDSSIQAVCNRALAMNQRHRRMRVSVIATTAGSPTDLITLDDFPSGFDETGCSRARPLLSDPTASRFHRTRRNFQHLERSPKHSCQQIGRASILENFVQNATGYRFATSLPFRPSRPASHSSESGWLLIELRKRERYRCRECFSVSAKRLFYLS